MTGPDLTNSLLGVLLRFRMEAGAVTADIEQMFYCFKVQESHQDYLRFLWYRNNDPSQEIIEYRMTAHVFGNSPSPAIATYGLRRSVESANPTVKQVVEKDFYVDDALVSTPTEDDAINLIQSTQSALKVGGNIRLHKITSNLDLNVDKPPPQRSHGLHWIIAEDTFTFQVSSERKPFTRRGVLSTINSLYDPLGIVAPVVVKGKLLLRGLMSTTTGWDEQLPVQYLPQWQKWCDSLKSLEKVMIPRPYSDSSFSASPNKTVHIFCDASKEAISAVAFIRIYSVSGPSNVSFVLGKTRVAPQHEHSIPRLELCAASVDVADILVKQLNLHRDSFNFYSDRKVVRGYIHNEKRRFHVYVANRTDRIRRSSQPSQWHHVPTDVNPADEATKLSSTWHYQNSLWLTGPEFLRSDETVNTHDMFPLIDPARDKELKPNVHSAKTAVSHSSKGTLFSDRFTKFSSWSRFIKTFSHLKHTARAYAKSSDSSDGWHLYKESRTTTALMLSSHQRRFDGALKRRAKRHQSVTKLD